MPATEDKKSISETMREMRDIFSRYELTRAELARTDELIKKLEEGRITISVIGQFKRGKSRLVNTMLGEELLPVGIVPVTAVVTAIEFGERAARVRFLNGAVREVALDELSEYINEQENSDNRLNVDRVELFCESDFLKRGLSLVDTPGVGSAHQKNTDAAYSYMRESDAAIFMLSVDSPINQIEIDFLKSAGALSGKFYFAVNKIDTIDGGELEEYLGYCRNLIGRLTKSEDIRLFPVSAKTGEGVRELKEAIEKDCSASGSIRKIMENSCRKKMRDIALSASSQIALYRNTLVMGQKRFDLAFAKLSGILEGVKTDAAEYAESFASNPRMLEVGLNEVKSRLSAAAKELFGIEYYYNLAAVDLYRGGETREDGQRDHKNDFLAAADELCESLKNAVSSIFMYKEEDTYTITKRIYELNALTRRLVRLRAELE